MRAEIEIHGAGPVGCVLALALRAAGRDAILLERKSRAAEPSFRPIALSYASRLILERLGAWGGIEATAIRTVQVSQQGAFGRTRMSAADAGVPALGYVVDYDALLQRLLSRVGEAGICIAEASSEALLLVHAEGASEEATTKHYGQEAIVALVGADLPSSGTAWERFTPQGPLALLPRAGRHCLIWGMPPERAAALGAAPAAEFLGALQGAFGARAGRFIEVSGRERVPLVLRVRRSAVAPRQAFVGNAAQTLHPVAGQGLNLGLRDAWDLARVLRDAPDPGDQQVLERFAATRKFDAVATIRVTDFLAGAFLERGPLLAAARGIALTALDICLPARRFFARRMIFGASAMP